jgi:hypothetical protein
MFDWISDRIIALLAFFPPLFVRDEEHFMLMRGMFALLFIALVVGVFASFCGNQPHRNDKNRKDGGS